MEGIFAEMLTMNEGKQHIFMQRVLFIFEVTKQKAGKAQVLRMPVSQWALECDICCMAGYVLEQMQHRKNSDNLIVFPEETIKLVMNRLIEGCLVSFKLFEGSCVG